MNKRKLQPPQRQKTGPKPPAPSSKRPRVIDPPPAAPSIVHVPEKTVRVHRNLRLLAKVDYVTDPEDRPVRFHYERPDRDYKEHIAFATFEAWATEDKWISERAMYYREIERRIIADRMEKLLEQRFRELDELSEDLGYFHEWVTPLREPCPTCTAAGCVITGCAECGGKGTRVKRHPQMIDEVDPKTSTYIRRANPFAGLPMYALPFESMEKAIAAFLKLDERLMLKRGDATSRTETTDGGERPSVLDPSKAFATKPTKEEVQAMARALLLKRQPELLQQTSIDVDALTEHGEANENGNTI